MFKRPTEFGFFREQLAELTTLAPGETEPARLGAWLAEQTAKLGCCTRHTNTRIVIDQASIGSSPATNDDMRGHRVWGEELRIQPGVFRFNASLRCPACRAAYALCPPEFHETSFDGFDTSTKERADAVACCRAFADQTNRHGCGFAMLVGTPGSGKTRLACNIVREMDNRDALYTRQGELTCALRATYGRKEVIMRRASSNQPEDESPPTPLETVQAVRFLILDEIGCNLLANDERLLIDELLKHRYEQRKPTILISNLALDQLKEFLGDALADRIKHASGNGRFILQFTGTSYRRDDGEKYLQGIR